MIKRWGVSEDYEIYESATGSLMRYADYDREKTRLISIISGQQLKLDRIKEAVLRHKDVSDLTWEDNPSMAVADRYEIALDLIQDILREE